MLLGIPKEITPNETRVPLIPASAERLVKKGVEIAIEPGLGASIGIADGDYTKAGAKIAPRSEVLKADMVMRLRKPPLAEVSQLKKNGMHVSFLDPFNEKDLIDAFASNNISAISMEMIPRTTIAQKMDALSSQANLAGYVTVLLAANHSSKIFPMMMTPAGTITPCRVFVIGAGVAGLQAIATAKRLGARVEAFDTRPVVEEQVQSLGAKFIKIDLGETGQTKDGYAKELTSEQLQKQREGMAKICAQSDVVITTAQLFGRKAPIVLTKDMVAAMKPGSIVVDMAVETGGNVEGSKLDQVVDVGGVKILGYGNLPGRVPVAASQMYSANLVNFFETFWDKDKKEFNLDVNNELIKGCLITHNGTIVNETIKKLRAKA
jgi:NAD(P) transhydrogenase subunit alpha